MLATTRKMAANVQNGDGPNTTSSAATSKSHAPMLLPRYACQVAQAASTPPSAASHASAGQKPSTVGASDGPSRAVTASWSIPLAIASAPKSAHSAPAQPKNNVNMPPILARPDAQESILWQ